LKRKNGTPVLATGALHKGAGGDVNTNIKGGKKYVWLILTIS
jgi:hypothetical protein